MFPSASKHYKDLMDEVEVITRPQLIVGLILSTLIMIASTYGLLVLLINVGLWDPINAEQLIRYTSYMVLASLGSTVLAGLICLVVIKYPQSVFLPFKIHLFLKKGLGEYFLSPDPENQDIRHVFRRAFYGSVLITGLSLTIISFDITASGEALITFGGTVMIISALILPITLMQFYYGPWLLKDAGLFHLDKKDRSLSNVGDDLEDILEFFAGLDIVLVILEFTLSTEGWTSIFIVLVTLGPLFTIVLNFTLVFMTVRNNTVTSMITLLMKDYDVPDMIGSRDYIRYSIIDLIDREIVSLDGFSTQPVPISEVGGSEGIVESDFEVSTPVEPDEPVPEYDDDQSDLGPEESGDDL